MTTDRAGLRAPVFEPLALGQVRPAGWLAAQLRIQADGMAGRLDEFWPDVARSRWIGGDAEGWERGPYWLDGLVPLAVLLDDERLMSKARYWIDQILSRQDEEGWLGPVLDSRWSYQYDPWPRFVVLKAFTQFHEATGDERIIPAMLGFLRKLQSVLRERPLRSWARFRWADLLISVHWLYERTGEQWLLELGETLEAQGFPWRAHFERFPFPDKCRREECDLSSHGVNNAMGIKTPAIWYRQRSDEADRDAVRQMIATLDHFHGQATGMFSCDEHLAGLNPSQGSELCTVVEYMYSLETALPIAGDPELADRLERLAYNALPATLTPDMWARQYVQQVNQVQCRVADDRVYTSNGPDANIYGLEPHFGCCTPNHAQGWPKFAAHLWMRSADNGLAAIVYAPCVVETDVASTPIRVEVASDYPFDDTVHITINPERPIRFALQLRVPGWAEGATVQVGDDEADLATPGSFMRIDQEWTSTTEVTMHFPMRPRVEQRPSGGAVVHVGPLLLGLKLGEEFRQIGGEQPHADWEVLPTTPWNYALALDPERPEQGIAVERRPVGAVPFSPEGAPLLARVVGQRLPEWGLEHNAAAPPPLAQADGLPDEELVLIPFGATNLRIAEFPLATP